VKTPHSTPAMLRCWFRMPGALEQQQQDPDASPQGTKLCSAAKSNQQRCCQPLLPLAAATYTAQCVLVPKAQSCPPKPKEPHELASAAQLGFPSSFRRENCTKQTTVQGHSHTTDAAQTGRRVARDITPGCSQAKQTSGVHSTIPTQQCTASQWAVNV
jgi:hypothetical protein